AAHPGADAAGDEERDLGVAQRGSRALQRRHHPVEVAVSRGHQAGRTRRRRHVTRPVGHPQDVQDGRPIRIAAAGDIHASEPERDRVASAFAELERGTDLVLLAGDLTTCGDPEEAAVLADVCRGREVPICAVLGNHDWHLNRTHEVVAALTDAGVRVLEHASATYDVRGSTVGVAGLKGFVGGFPDYVLPDFGEPLLRQVYAETTEDVAALDRELRTIDGCDVRIVLL